MTDRRTDPPELSVVIPVWNGEHSLGKLLPRLSTVIEATVPRQSEVIVALPDGDPAAALVERSGGHVVPFKNAGYGAALNAGLAAARGRWVITMDADFTHSPEFVRTLWLRRREADVLIASRYVPGAVAEMPLSRRVLSRTLNRLYRTVLALPHRDLSSGFRMYGRAVLEDVGPATAEGLDALQEILVKAFSQGWKILEVPLFYRQFRGWTGGRLAELSAGYLTTLGRLVALRNSVKAADYDHRAFDSWIPLQRYWQRARFRVIRGMVDGATGILDIGCGSSRIVQTLPQAVGLDMQIRKLRWLRAPGRQLVQGSLSDLPFADESFDAVICSEVIEHIPRDRIDLTDMVRVLAPGGRLVLGTPDYGRWIWRTLESLYKKVFPQGYATEHINPYTRRELRMEIEKLGLVVLDVQYVGGSEMIFKAVKPTQQKSASRPALRIARS
ncbi:MAG: methyltransferase domain-containing protein [Actinobacteria bacterium]|nr:MAG: methyltransferase domain-containing protein [Actinomycetota bacterium]